MNPATTVFPKTSATFAQLGVHGEAAAQAARDAYHAPDTASRLDSLVQTYDAFDHAARDAQSLPLDRFVPGIGAYEKGYNIARLGVTALVASGVVPGARERMGKQELLDAQNHFHSGLDAVAANSTRYTRARANDWLSHSIEDASTGLLYVRRGDVALPLLRGLSDARSAVAHRKELPAADVLKLDQLFTSATSSLDETIAAAQAAALPVDPAQSAQVDEAARQSAAEAVAFAERAAHDLAANG